MLLVISHELGHFLCARLLGVKVLRVAIGFGKSITLKQTRHGTRYTLGWLLLGGYVKLLDENDAPVAASDAPYAYNRQPPWKRACIVLAGPFANIIFAVLLFFLMYLIGFSSPALRINNIAPNSPAAKAHIPKHANIIAIDQHKVFTWQQVNMMLLTNIGNSGHITLTVRHASQENHYLIPITHWLAKQQAPMPLKALGIKPYIPSILPIVGHISAPSALVVGDRILDINGIAIKDWQQIINTINQYPTQVLNVTVMRHHQLMVLHPIVEVKHSITGLNSATLNIFPKATTWPTMLLNTIKFDNLEALQVAVNNVLFTLHFNMIMLIKLLSGKISFSQLGGPISIFEGAALMIHLGLSHFLNLLAFLSLAVAFVNLLPLPGLDGGQLLFIIIEKCRGQALSIALQALLIRLSIIFLVIFAIQITLNDIERLLLH